MLVQELAWASMLVTYTQERGFKRGIVETFDGGHPCGLCHKAAEIHRKEQAPESDDKRLPERAPRFAWAEMVVSERLCLPARMGSTVAGLRIPLITRDAGRGADAPDAPPPERV